MNYGLGRVSFVYTVSSVLYWPWNIFLLKFHVDERSFSVWRNSLLEGRFFSCRVICLELNECTRESGRVWRSLEACYNSLLIGYQYWNIIIEREIILSRTLLKIQASSSKRDPNSFYKCNSILDHKTLKLYLLILIHAFSYIQRNSIVNILLFGTYRVKKYPFEHLDMHGGICCNAPWEIRITGNTEVRVVSQSVCLVRNIPGKC